MNVSTRVFATPNGVGRGNVKETKEITSSIKVLQHFEHEVLLAVSSLGENSFPAEITRRLSDILERHVSLAQVFVALERLEDKGYVNSHESNPEPVRGGRRRRIFQIEESGKQALRKTVATFSVNRMSSAGHQSERLNAETYKPSSA